MFGKTSLKPTSIPILANSTSSFPCLTKNFYPYFANSAMNPNLLIKIADTINNNGSKFHAVIPCSKHDYMIQEGNQLQKSCCYVLRIMVSGKTKNHVKRSVWNIYEYDMDRIILKVSRRDKDFAERIKSCEPTPHDVENIVRRASFGSLRLKIVDSSFYLYMGEKE